MLKLSGGHRSSGYEDDSRPLMSIVSMLIWRGMGTSDVDEGFGMLLLLLSLLEPCVPLPPSMSGVAPVDESPFGFDAPETVGMVILEEGEEEGKARVSEDKEEEEALVLLPSDKGVDDDMTDGEGLVFVVE